MKKVFVGIMVTLLLVFATTACAEEYNLFQDIILERNGNCPSKMIILNDEVVFSVPEHWSEAPIEEGDMVCYQYQDAAVDVTLYAGCVFRPEISYEEVQERVKTISKVACTANKSGFTWTAGKTENGFGVIHGGKNGHFYVLLFIIDIKNDEAYECVVRDCGYILHSFNSLLPVIYSSDPQSHYHRYPAAPRADVSHHRYLS